MTDQSPAETPQEPAAETASDATTPPEDTQTQQAAGEAPEGVEEAPEPAENDEPHDPAAKARREAAKYRKRAQQAESERDALSQQLDNTRARVTALQEQLVVRELFARDVRIDALKATGTRIEELFTDAGDLDQGRVDAAVKEAVQRLGLSPRPVGYVPTAGTGDPAPAEITWADALSKATLQQN